MSPVTRIDIASLHQGALDTQRPHLDQACVERYMADLHAAPPVLVYEHAGERILVNGHHRVEAARRLGRTWIEAEVRPGTRLDATRYFDDRRQSQR
jgi:hypothetical protein